MTVRFENGWLIMPDVAINLRRIACAEREDPEWVRLWFSMLDGDGYLVKIKYEDLIPHLCA